MKLNILIAVPAATALLGLGCKNNCEKLYDHTVQMLETAKAPADKLEELKGEKGKEKALDLCRYEDQKAVKCAVEKSTLEEFKKCRPEPDQETL